MDVEGSWQRLLPLLPGFGGRVFLQSKKGPGDGGLRPERLQHRRVVRGRAGRYVPLARYGLGVATGAERKRSPPRERASVVPHSPVPLAALVPQRPLGPLWTSSKETGVVVSLHFGRQLGPRVLASAKQTLAELPGAAEFCRRRAWAATRRSRTTTADRHLFRRVTHQPDVDRVRPSFSVLVCLQKPPADSKFMLAEGGIAGSPTSGSG